MLFLLSFVFSPSSLNGFSLSFNDDFCIIIKKVVIINSAAMNIGVHVSLSLLVSSPVLFFLTLDSVGGLGLGQVPESSALTGSC